MRKNVDMTVGSPTKIIFLFMLPIIFNYVLQQFYSLADSTIVALALGNEAVTGVNLTGSLSFLVIGFSQGCSGGFGVLLSQFVGAKDERKIKNSFAVSIFLTLVIATCLTVLSLTFSRPLLTLLKTNELYIDYSNAYIRAIFSGIVFTMFYNLASQILLAFGDSKSPLIILFTSAVLNVGLNSLLFIKDMTVAWAGWATVISQAAAAVVGFVIIFKKIPALRIKREDFKFTAKFALAHLGMGLPMAFQFSITAIGCMIQQRAFNLFPPEYSMAQSTGSKINGIFDAGVLSAFGTAMGTYCGQNYGAKRFDRIESGVKAGFLVGGGLTLFSMAAALAVCYPLSYVLLPNASSEVYSHVFTYILINSSMYVFLMLIFFFRHALQGTGRSMTAAFGGVIELIARTVCAFTLATVLFKFACFSNPMAWISAGLFLMVSFLICLKQEKKRYGNRED